MTYIQHQRLIWYKSKKQNFKTILIVTIAILLPLKINFYYPNHYPYFYKNMKDYEGLHNKRYYKRPLFKGLWTLMKTYVKLNFYSHSIVETDYVNLQARIPFTASFYTICNCTKSLKSAILAIKTCIRRQFTRIAPCYD